MKKWGAARFLFVLLAFIVLYAIILLKLFYWQVVRSEDLKKIGENQSTEALFLPAKRGDIVTSDNFPIATNKTSYLFYANPKLIKDKDFYSSVISDIIGVPEASIAARLSKDLFWVRLASRVDVQKKTQIETWKFPGLGFEPESDRYYPEASMAAHLVGFVGKNSEGNNKGYFGVEGYYNDQLEGRSGRLYVIRDALGNQIANDIREEKKIDGRTLVLTIDRTVQFIAQKKLKDAVEKYNADGGSVIAMDTKTGKILAMASFPSFDMQKYYDFDYSSYKNPAITEVYEPGSTFKVLVMAAGIDAGVVKPDTKCDTCGSAVQIGEYKIKTWDDKYYPNTTMTDVIQHSDNTGMVFVGKKLGLSKFLHYLDLFGLGDKTKIDLQGEVTSNIKAEKLWYPIDVATATFGQGISLTAMQLLNSVNSVANDGNLMKPYVVSKIITEDGKTIDVLPKTVRRTISSAASKVMSQILVNAVENGEAKWVKIKNYKIAGKTGTAQIPLAGHYDPNQTNASFVGFFPADDPKVTMLVLINKPKTSIYGAETAAPVFFSIARDLINYYNIPPSK